MILGSKEEIEYLVTSQAKFVGDNYDIDGALGSIPLEILKDSPKEKDLL